MLTHFPLVDVSILMDPNGSPLQVFNPTLRTTWLYTIPLGCSIPCRHPARNRWPRLYTSAPLPGIHWFHADECYPVLQQTTLNPTCSSDVNEEILRQEDYSRRPFLEAKKSGKGDPDQNVSLWVKYYIVTYIWKIESCLMNKDTVPKSFCSVVWPSSTRWFTPGFAGVTPGSHLYQGYTLQDSP